MFRRGELHYKIKYFRWLLALRRPVHLRHCWHFFAMKFGHLADCENFLSPFANCKGHECLWRGRLFGKWTGIAFRRMARRKKYRKCLGERSCKKSVGYSVPMKPQTMKNTYAVHAFCNYTVQCAKIRLGKKRDSESLMYEKLWRSWFLETTDMSISSSPWAGNLQKLNLLKQLWKIYGKSEGCARDENEAQNVKAFNFKVFSNIIC